MLQLPVIFTDTVFEHSRVKNKIGKVCSLTSFAVSPYGETQSIYGRGGGSTVFPSFGQALFKGY